MQKESKTSLICFLAIIFTIFSYLCNSFENYRLINQIKVLIIDNQSLEEQNFLLKDHLNLIK